MCGYCFETNEVIPALMKIYGGHSMPINAMLPSNFLQEHKNLAVGLRRMVQKNEKPVFWDVVQCRLLESYLLKGFDKNRYRRLSVAANGDLFADYFDRPEVIMHPIVERWKILWEPQLYAEGRQWNAFLADSHKLEANAIETLSFYVEWWLEGKNKETNDPDDLLKQTGIFDPIQVASESSIKQFYQIFPAVYFSLIYLWRQSIKPDLIKSVAIIPPNDCPDFVAYDLWLQRKAFCLFATTIGVHEAIRQASEIRMALIFQAMLSLPLSQQEISLAFDSIEERQENLFSFSNSMSLEEEIGWLKRTLNGRKC